MKKLDKFHQTIQLKNMFLMRVLNLKLENSLALNGIDFRLILFEFIFRQKPVEQ